MKKFFPWRQAGNQLSSAQHEYQSGIVAQADLSQPPTKVIRFGSVPTTSQVPLQILNNPTADTIEAIQEMTTRALPSEVSKATSNIRDAKWGLFLLNPISHSDANESPGEYPIDIVAVHGITGSAYSTWTCKDKTNSALWLRDFLPQEFPGARIFTYGYPADVFFSKERGDIGTFARTLLDKLLREREENDYRHRPIIFICHSMGGIVVKQVRLPSSFRGHLLMGTQALITA